jgi:hypothetical protein
MKRKFLQVMPYSMFQSDGYLYEGKLIIILNFLYVAVCTGTRLEEHYCSHAGWVTNRHNKPCDYCGEVVK